MYEENVNKIDWKNIIKKLIFVLIIIFVIFGIITLISRCSKKDETKVEQNESINLSGQLDQFEEAILKYLSKDNLPVEINSSKTIRLKLLTSKNLIELIKDEKGTVCDENENYAEVTRLENNYAIKLSLTCGKNKDYKVIYAGCFAECNGGICVGSETSKGICTLDTNEEKNNEENTQVNKEENKGQNSTTTKKPTSNNTTTNKKPTNTNTTPTTPAKKTEYEYQQCTETCKYGTLNKTSGKCETTYSPYQEYVSYRNSAEPFKVKVDYIGYKFNGYADSKYNYIKYICTASQKYDYNSGLCVSYSNPEKTCKTMWSTATSLDGWIRTGNTK